MTDFPCMTLSECADRIISAKNPLVIMHIRPDGDTVGSGAALCEIFKALGKEARYLCEDGIPKRLAFLVEGIDSANSADGFEAISIDVASPSQMGTLAEKVKVSFSIDHHAVSTPFAPHYTVSAASSAGEVLFGIARELESRNLIKISKRVAYLIFAAISSDTGGFAFSNATEATFRAAADLISLGIDQAEINHKLFMSKSKEQIAAEGFTASNVKTFADGKISYAVISKKNMDSLGLKEECFDAAIDVVRSLSGAEIALIVKETHRGFKASIRSLGANVASVAARHGGGGHIRAAGCTVDARSAKEAAEILLSELSELL